MFHEEGVVEGGAIEEDDLMETPTSTLEANPPPRILVHPQDHHLWAQAVEVSLVARPKMPKR